MSRKQELRELVATLLTNVDDEESIAPLLAIARLALVFQESRRCSQADRVMIAEHLRDIADKVERRKVLAAS